jgi:hypothetical protein
MHWILGSLWGRARSVLNHFVYKRTNSHKVVSHFNFSLSLHVLFTFVGAPRVLHNRSLFDELVTVWSPLVYSLWKILVEFC